MDRRTCGLPYRGTAGRGRLKSENLGLKLHFVWLGVYMLMCVSGSWRWTSLQNNLGMNSQHVITRLLYAAGKYSSPTYRMRTRNSIFEAPWKGGVVDDHLNAYEVEGLKIAGACCLRTAYHLHLWASLPETCLRIPMILRFQLERRLLLLSRKNLK